MSIFSLELGSFLAGLIHLGFAIAATTHAVLYKRDVRAAIGWIGLIWFVPLFGSIAYALFGINRIRRRATELRREQPSPPPVQEPSEAVTQLAGSCPAMTTLAGYVRRITGTPLTTGNAILPLRNGDEAYPAMLSAINGASRSIALSTFIFDRDPIGREFTEALSAAVGRGVEVRVLIDSVGARYSRPRITRLLCKHGIMTKEFLRPLLPWRSPYLNLRNHRKLLVVDGQSGFTGGLNIRQSCLLASQPRHPVQDLHFRLEGPVVKQLMHTFGVDWHFVSGERLAGDAWFPPLAPAGTVIARGIADGPDEDFETIRWTLMGALSAARQRVVIQTPYFLPDQALFTALGMAARRGVEVDILLPERSNLRFVQWAAAAQMWQVLEHGCHVWLAPPPFDHGKLMVVDDCWSLIGSANWDPRSLRLNFEFDVECYDRPLTTRLCTYLETIKSTASPLLLEDINNRPLPVKLRDGVVRLFSPYL